MNLFHPRAAWKYGHHLFPLPQVIVDAGETTWLSCVPATERGIHELLTAVEPVLLLMQVAGFKLQILRVASFYMDDQMVEVNFTTMLGRKTSFDFNVVYPEPGFPDGKSHVVAIQVERPVVPGAAAERLESWSDDRIHLLGTDGEMDDLIVLLTMDVLENPEEFQGGLLDAVDAFVRAAIEVGFSDAAVDGGILDHQNWTLGYQYGETGTAVADRQVVFHEVGEALKSTGLAEGASIRELLLAELPLLQSDPESGKVGREPTGNLIYSASPWESPDGLIQAWAGALPRGDPFAPLPTSSNLDSLSPLELLADAGERGVLFFGLASSDDAPGFGMYYNLKSTIGASIRRELVEAVGLWSVTPELALIALQNAQSTMQANWQVVDDELESSHAKLALSAALDAFDDMEANFGSWTKLQLYAPLTAIGRGLLVCDPFWAEADRDTDFVAAFWVGFERGLGDQKDNELLKLQERFIEYQLAAPFLQPVFQTGVTWGAALAAKEWIEDLGDLLTDPKGAVLEMVEAVRAIAGQSLVDLADTIGEAVGVDAIAKIKHLAGQPNCFYFYFELGEIFGPILLEVVISIVLEPIAIAAVMSAAKKALMVMEKVKDGVNSIPGIMRHKDEITTKLADLAHDADPLPVEPERWDRELAETLDAEIPAHTRNLAELLEGDLADHAIEGIKVIQEACTPIGGDFNRELFVDIMHSLCKGKLTRNWIACIGKAATNGRDRGALVDALRATSNTGFKRQITGAIADQYPNVEDLFDGLTGVDLRSDMAYRVHLEWDKEYAKNFDAVLAAEIKANKLTAWEHRDSAPRPIPHPASPDGETWPGIVEGWIRAEDGEYFKAEHDTVLAHGRSVDSDLTWNACHLFGRRFGGISDANTNLVACHARVNTSFMKSIENRIAELFDEHGDLYLRVEVGSYDENGIAQRVTYVAYIEENDLPKRVFDATTELNFQIVPGHVAKYGVDVTEGQILNGLWGWQRHSIESAEMFSQ